MSIIEVNVISGELKQRELTDAEVNMLKNQEPSTEQLATAARAKRDGLLSETVDKVNAIRWSAMTDTQKSAWTAYRQELLDIPEQAGFPVSILWPEVPA